MILLKSLFRIFVFVPRAVFHLLRVAWRDTDSRGVRRDGSRTIPQSSDTLNDASGLNATPLRRFVRPQGSASEIVAQLTQLLQDARDANVGICVAGARHSMGGKALVRDGFVIDLSGMNSLSLDEQNRVLTVGAGARWAEVLDYLDEFGLSVHVMQSYNTFSVGGSLSVNCHGDQYSAAPISSTVISFRILRANGLVQTCSRTENRELFSLALGGYGLFGIVLDVRLRVVRNAALMRSTRYVRVDEIADVFRRAAELKPPCQMIYARPCMAASGFLQDCFVQQFAISERPGPDFRSAPFFNRIRRLVFLGTLKSAFGKELRWLLESRVVPAISSNLCTRRHMQEERAETFENRTNQTTEVIHEYFLPPNNMPRFIARVRELILDSGVELVNSSFRMVEEDRDTFLRYADQPMLTVVLMFHRQLHSAEQDDVLVRLTRLLIDAARGLGGRFYLPYRLHATPEQLLEAYPMAAEFFAAKRRYDPDGIFQNHFYHRYGHSYVAAKTN